MRGYEFTLTAALKAQSSRELVGSSRAVEVLRRERRQLLQVAPQSDGKNPTTGTGVGLIVAFLVIRRTSSSLSGLMLTAESASEFVAAEIGNARDGTYRLAGVSRNGPKLSVSDRSPIHYGASVLYVQGDAHKELAGYCCIDRNSRGELRRSERHNSIASSFTVVQELLPLDKVANSPANAEEAQP